MSRLRLTKKSLGGDNQVKNHRLPIWDKGIPVAC
nr:MAG TPA: hypothetical protein [Bacteriophage sp.]